MWRSYVEEAHKQRVLHRQGSEGSLPRVFRSTQRLLLGSLRHLSRGVQMARPADRIDNASLTK